MEIEPLIVKAKTILLKQDCFLLAYDIISSRSYPDRAVLMKWQHEIAFDLNTRYAPFFPSTNINTLIRWEKGFEIIVGDSSWAAINSEECIEPIIKYVDSRKPPILLRWGVFADGWELKEWPYDYKRI